MGAPQILWPRGSADIRSRRSSFRMRLQGRFSSSDSGQGGCRYLSKTTRSQEIQQHHRAGCRPKHGEESKSAPSSPGDHTQYLSLLFLNLHRDSCLLLLYGCGSTLKVSKEPVHFPAPALRSPLPARPRSLSCSF